MVAQHHLGSELAAQSLNCNALRSPRSCLGVGSHVSVELTFPFYLADMSLLLKKESILLLHCLVGSPVDPGVVPLAPPHSGELRTQKLKSHLMRTQSLNVLPLKPGVGQYISIHATLTARDFFRACFYTSDPFTCIFSKTSPDFSLCWLWLTHGSCVGPQNKIDHPAGCRFPC